MGLADAIFGPQGPLSRQSFNPCFDGWGSPTPQGQSGFDHPCFVSILVLMDGARRQNPAAQKTLHCAVSILVLMDGARRRFKTKPGVYATKVSILVLMDGARRLFDTKEANMLKT